MGAMQKYHKVEQKYPDTRPAKQRAKDFEEIYEEFKPEKAQAQAERCLQCGVPFCQVHCPLHNNIPDWLRLTAEGRLRDAYEMASRTNTFPEICGRICPQDRLCEGGCVVKDFGAITIGSVEKYITETAWENGWVEPFAPAVENGYSIGIVGAGPAGLAAAEQLRRAGCAVHIYDRYDRVGGLMIYGIPNFKLEKDVVARREQQYRASGIQFHLGMDIGRGISFSELRSRHDAVLIATGVYKARDVKLPGSELSGIVEALDYLVASNKHGLGDKVERYNSGELNAKGKRVVVIGGGDTAMDCVRTAIRQGATKVTCLYRRDRENMPGSAKEVLRAEEEGVEFVWLSVPEEFRSKKGSKVDEIRVGKMRLGPADASGRRSPVAIEGASYGLDADLVIKALGFEPEDLPVAFNEMQLQLSQWGTLKVDKQMMTSLDGVFAAGDIVRGASLVVWAIADGREAATAMLKYIEQKQQRAA